MKIISTPDHDTLVFVLLILTNKFLYRYFENVRDCFTERNFTKNENFSAGFFGENFSEQLACRLPPRGAFRTQPSIRDGAFFCENTKIAESC